LEIGKPIHYLDFERQSDIAKLAAPELYLGKFADHLVILDEIQRLPHQLQFLSSTYSYPALDVFVVKKFIVGG
jgi:predicted AAA+ superfamily ATPase